MANVPVKPPLKFPAPVRRHGGMKNPVESICSICRGRIREGEEMYSRNGEDWHVGCDWWPEAILETPGTARSGFERRVGLRDRRGRRKAG